MAHQLLPLAGEGEHDEHSGCIHVAVSRYLRR
jgi:hypothetical protein